MFSTYELPKLSTTDLIAQYYAAIAVPRWGAEIRHRERRIRQTRVNRIVNLLSARADSGDTEAETWLRSPSILPINR